MSQQSRNEASQKWKPYIKCIRPPELHTPERAQPYRSFVPTFDPGEFVRDPWQIVAQVLQIQGFGGEVVGGVCGAGEAKMDMGYVWGGGGFEGRKYRLDIVERPLSPGPAEAEGHRSEPWELGNVEGPLERLLTTYTREKYQRTDARTSEAGGSEGMRFTGMRGTRIRQVDESLATRFR